MANKVKFNLKNVHIAPKTLSGYGEIFAMPGAVSLSLDPQGDIEKFYADGIVYYQSAPNNGYEGSLELALVPDKFRTDILKETESSNGLLVENVDSKMTDFAMGFQIDGDVNNRYYWFYNCSVSRPSLEATTLEESKTPQTETLNISCVSDENGNIKVRSTDSFSGGAEAWFADVIQPVA